MHNIQINLKVTEANNLLSFYIYLFCILSLIDQ